MRDPANEVANYQPTIDRMSFESQLSVERISIRMLIEYMPIKMLIADRLRVLINTGPQMMHQVKSRFQVNFYCAIHLAFVKKDHQLVYRYSTENEIKQFKLKLRKNTYNK